MNAITPDRQRQEIEAILEKLETLKPVPRQVKCTSPEGVVAWAANPSWPPKTKGGCEADDYGMFVFEDVMPKLIPYIRSLQSVQDTVLREHGEMRDRLCHIGSSTPCLNCACKCGSANSVEGLKKLANWCLEKVPDRSIPPKA